MFQFYVVEVLIIPPFILECLRNEIYYCYLACPDMSSDLKCEEEDKFENESGETEGINAEIEELPEDGAFGFNQEARTPEWQSTLAEHQNCNQFLQNSVSVGSERRKSCDVRSLKNNSKEGYDEHRNEVAA